MHQWCLAWSSEYLCLWYEFSISWIWLSTLVCCPLKVIRNIFKRTHCPGRYFWDYYHGNLFLNQIAATNLKIGQPKISSMGVWSWKELLHVLHFVLRKKIMLIFSLSFLDTGIFQVSDNLPDGRQDYFYPTSSISWPLMTWTWWHHQMETFSALLATCAGNFLHKGQWREALVFSLICTWINGWVNNGEAGDLRHHGTHYDVTVMWCKEHTCFVLCFVLFCFGIYPF